MRRRKRIRKRRRGEREEDEKREEKEECEKREEKEEEEQDEDEEEKEKEKKGGREERLPHLLRHLPFMDPRLHYHLESVAWLLWLRCAFSLSLRFASLSLAFCYSSFVRASSVFLLVYIL